MSHVIIRGENGRRHEVDFGEAAITVSLHASEQTVELAIEADDPDRPSHKKRFALANIPRHLFSKAMADLARQDRQAGKSPKHDRNKGHHRGPGWSGGAGHVP